MASVHAADTWRETGARADRSAGGPGASRSGRPAPGDRPARPPLPPLPPLPSHGRSGSPGQRPSAPAQRPVPPPPRPAAQGRPAQRPPVPPVDRSGGSRHAGEPARATPGYPRPSASLSPDADRRRARPQHDDAPRAGEQDRRPGSRGTAREVREVRVPEAAVPETGSRLRGSVAVLGVLLVTLAAGYVDAIGTTGLGMITLVGLVAGTALATLLVRRRDLTTMVVAPPLVLLAATAVHVLTSPAFEVGEGANAVVAAGTAVATKLVLGGGFPIMAAATGTALVLALIRWAARR